MPIVQLTVVLINQHDFKGIEADKQRIGRQSDRMRLAHLLIHMLSSTGLLLDGRPAGRGLEVESTSARRLAPSSVDDSSVLQLSTVGRRSAVWGLVGGLLSPVVVVPLVPAAAAGGSGTMATTTTATTKVQGPTNKRIGGLASKIRSVCNVMVSALYFSPHSQRTAALVNSSPLVCLLTRSMCVVEFRRTSCKEISCKSDGI